MCIQREKKRFLFTRSMNYNKVLIYHNKCINFQKTHLTIINYKNSVKNLCNAKSSLKSVRVFSVFVLMYIHYMCLRDSFHGETINNEYDSKKKKDVSFQLVNKYRYRNREEKKILKKTHPLSSNSATCFQYDQFPTYFLCNFMPCHDLTPTIEFVFDTIQGVAFACQAID